MYAQTLRGGRLTRCSVLSYRDIMSHFLVRVLLGLVEEGKAEQSTRNTGGWKGKVCPPWF